MKKRELQKFFKKGRAVIPPESYAIVRSRRACSGAFAVIRDDMEITCILEEGLAAGREFAGYDGGWRRITFSMVLPFGLVGFLAAVANALAAAGISIMSVSSYSTDHVFVKDRDLDKAVKALTKLGFSVDRL